MMVMTAKVDFKKVMMFLAAAAAVILAVILLMGGGSSETAATGQKVAGNDARVQFLKDFGWEVTTSPTESSQVRIPEETSQVYIRYNALQQAQGYDLTEYAGKNVMRFVYAVNNYPGATEPVYATLLVYKNQVIGGDITNTAPGGKIHGFKGPEGTVPSSKPAATAPSTAPMDTQSAATDPEEGTM